LPKAREMSEMKL